MASATYKVEVDWDNDGGFLDANEDISADVKSISYSRGKDEELGKASPGTLSIRVNNSDGKYSPTLNTGIYTNLLPKRVIRVRTTAPAAYNLFYGYIETITPHPDLASQDCYISAIDGLDFLARHELDTILYKDKLTGYLVNEIVDSAYGNLLTNGSFEDGDPPDNWLLAGAAATLSRSNVQAIIGTYSALLTRNGTNCYLHGDAPEFARYQGRQGILGCWVWASVATRARLLIWDGVGIPGISDYHSGGSTWEWITVTGTVNAAATVLRAQLQVDNGDTAAYFDGAILVEGSRVPEGKILDAGQDTVPYAHWHTVKAKFGIGEIEDSELGFFIIGGDGSPKYEDRHHRYTATHQTSQATFSDTMADISYDYSARNVYNEVRATVTPWNLESEATLWTLEEVPSIPAGETLTWWGDASVDGMPVFVDAWVTPASTTDYTANSQADGGGVDRTSDITIFTTKFVKSIKLAITNDAAHIVYITLLKARGTYYDSLTKVSRKSEDATSQTAYQKRTLPLEGKYLTDADKAQDFCDYGIARFKDPQAEAVITIVNKDATNLTQILTRKISDRITAVNTKLGLNADFFINKMEHEITEGGHRHLCRWYLADAANEDFWCLDYSELGTGTKLGY